MNASSFKPQKLQASNGLNSLRLLFSLQNNMSGRQPKVGVGALQHHQVPGLLLQFCSAILENSFQPVLATLRL